MVIFVPNLTVDVSNKRMEPKLIVIHLNTGKKVLPVSAEHLIALLTSQSFQILLTARMFPVWDFVVGIFARKALLNSGRVLSTLSC